MKASVFIPLWHSIIMQTLNAKKRHEMIDGLSRACRLAGSKFQKQVPPSPFLFFPAPFGNTPNRLKQSL